MSDNTVLKLSQPSTFSDPLTEVLRSGAQVPAGAGGRGGGCRVP